MRGCPPHPLMPEAGGRTDPEVTRAGELPLPHPPPAATFGKAGPAPHLGNTIEPTLLAEG